METFDVEENPLDKVLEEKFRLFSNHQEAPQELKEEVFASLDVINFAAEFAGLFTVKFFQTGLHLIETTLDHQGEKKDLSDW